MKTSKRKLVEQNLLPGLGNDYKLLESITVKDHGYGHKCEIFKEGKLFATILNTADIHSYDNEFDIEYANN